MGKKQSVLREKPGITALFFRDFPQCETKRLTPEK
jgi:hypothetical protein